MMKKMMLGPVAMVMVAATACDAPPSASEGLDRAEEETAGPTRAASAPDKTVAEQLGDDCAAGTARACVELAAHYLKGRKGLPKSDADAYRYLTKGCAAGDMFGCEMQAKMLRDGRGTTPQPAAARKLFEKACSGQSYGACTSLGLDLIKTDKKRARSLFEKACDGEDGMGCMGLGALYLHGNGVPKNPVLAKTLLQKACRLGQPSACTKAQTL